MDCEKYKELEIKKKDLLFELKVIVQNAENYSQSFIDEQISFYKDKILKIDKQFINEKSNYYDIAYLIKETISELESVIDREKQSEEDDEHKSRMERIKANTRKGSIKSCTEIDENFISEKEKSEEVIEPIKPCLEPIPDTSHLKKKSISKKY